MSIEPQNVPTHIALAEAWSWLGYDERALEEAGKALKLSGTLSPEMRLWVNGKYYELDNEFDKAKEAYQALWKLSPDNLDYGLQLAMAQIGAGDGQGALATTDALRKTSERARDDPRIDLQEADTPWGSTYPIALDPANFPACLSAVIPMSFRSQQEGRSYGSPPRRGSWLRRFPALLRALHMDLGAHRTRRVWAGWVILMRVSGESNRTVTRPEQSRGQLGRHPVDGGLSKRDLRHWTRNTNRLNRCPRPFAKLYLADGSRARAHSVPRL